MALLRATRDLDTRAEIRRVVSHGADCGGPKKEKAKRKSKTPAHTPPMTKNSQVPSASTPITSTHHASYNTCASQAIANPISSHVRARPTNSHVACACACPRRARELRYMLDMFSFADLLSETAVERINTQLNDFQYHSFGMALTRSASEEVWPRPRPSAR